MRIFAAGIIGALLMGFVGLVSGVLYSVGGFFVDVFTIGLNAGTWMAFGALIGMPVIFAAFGFVAGALVATVAIAATAILRGG